jgi:uncharacterized RDD family membrane protein YckC
MIGITCPECGTGLAADASACPRCGVPPGEEGLPPGEEGLPPGREDLLGLRIAAAFIDLVVLAGLFTILSAAVGQTTVSGGTFNVYLSGAWLAVFLAVALGYYFVLEAWAGQTLGKRLFGLQVQRAGGTRPSVGAVALRTLLRIIDWLPLLYLAGFITVLATGARRQRIGDLAARTVLARAPVRHRGPALVLLAAVALAAVALPVYRAASAGGTQTGTQTYRGHGVSFGYPAGWSEESSVPIGSSGGADQLWTTDVGPGTPVDSVTVTAYRMKQPLTAADLETAAPYLESRVRQLFTVQGGPEKTTMAGMPGLRFHVTGTVKGARFHSTLVFAFNGTTEYYVECQYTPAKAAEVEQACAQVTGSFHITGAAPGAAAAGTRPPSPAATRTTTPAAASTTPGSSPARGTPGSGGLGAKVVPAPAGFALFQSPDVHNGPMSAADFNQYWGDAASNHFVRGYDVTYDSNDTSDFIEVTLLQFATPADAAAFKAGYVPAGPVKSKADAVIPGADGYDSTSPYHGMYDHGVIAAKGNLAFVIDGITSSAAPVPLVETMARQQYAAL